MAVLRYMGWITSFSVFAAFISIIWQSYITLRALNKNAVLLTNLLAIENSIQRPPYVPPPKVAIGYGACTDLQINATEFLNTYYQNIVPVIGAEFTVDKINDENELLQTFAYYFKNGAAAERIILNDTLFKNLVNKAKMYNQDSIHWYMGGNAPLMAVRFQMEGAEVLLGAHMSKKLRALLPNTIRLAGDEIFEDDIHLIMEYKAGDTWGSYVAPRANRYILHNDKHNPHLPSIKPLHLALESFKPQLLVISGLQMMDSYKFFPGVREERLQQVKMQLTSQDRDTLIHFEMASYVELKLLLQLRDFVLPYVDSIGMNEQELENLRQVLENGRTTLAADWNPRVAYTLDQMRQVFIMLARDYMSNNATYNNRRLVTRIHVHTLAYQVIMSVSGSKWKHTRLAATKAALTAYRYVCKSQFVNPEAAILVLDDSFATSAMPTAPRIHLNVVDAVPCWNEFIQYSNESDQIKVEICVAPVLVCRVAKKTAGAGDNISATSLAAQI